MEIDRIKKLIKLLNDSDLSHLEVEDKSGHIVLEKQISNVPPATAPVEAKTFEPEKTAKKVIKAPFVGNFYTSEQPDKAPLVKAGDKVEKDQVVGIIEAMKMMNEIKSDLSGTIDKVLVTNGDAVEYDQPLFTLKD